MPEVLHFLLQMCEQCCGQFCRVLLIQVSKFQSTSLSFSNTSNFIIQQGLEQSESLYFILLKQILGSHSSAAEDPSLLRCAVVSLGQQFLMLEGW